MLSKEIIQELACDLEGSLFTLNFMQKFLSEANNISKESLVSIRKDLSIELPSLERILRKVEGYLEGEDE